MFVATTRNAGRREETDSLNSLTQSMHSLATPLLEHEAARPHSSPHDDFDNLDSAQCNASPGTLLCSRTRPPQGEEQPGHHTDSRHIFLLLVILFWLSLSSSSPAYIRTYIQTSTCICNRNSNSSSSSRSRSRSNSYHERQSPSAGCGRPLLPCVPDSPRHLAQRKD